MTAINEMIEWLKSINNDYSEDAKKKVTEDDGLGSFIMGTGEETRPIDISIKEGDKVRSYDFDYSDDCYVDGTVVGFEFKDGSKRYVLKMSKKVFDGNDETKKYFAVTGNDTFYPPVNGLKTWMGELTCGVQKR